MHDVTLANVCTWPSASAPFVHFIATLPTDNLQLQRQLWSRWIESRMTPASFRRSPELGRRLRSVRSRSAPAGVLTVSASKPSFASATGAGTSDSYTKYS